MSPKNQIYLLAGSTIVLGAATAFLAYRNYTVKNELAAWYKVQQDTVRNTLPAEIKKMLDKAIS